MTGDTVVAAAFRGQFGAFALDANFTMPSAGVTALFGPSGCGKTTVLRCIAGLQRATTGSCVVAGEVWQDATTFLPAYRRPIGYVFQEPSLFAHLTVRRNLVFGMRRRPADDPATGVGFDEMVELLGLAALLERSPRKLSGGERQRVAIGRALLSRPKLLLMDEPLSALDRPSKDEIIPFLERLQHRLAIPTLYVTHDMAEVERLAATLVLMREGSVIGAGPLSTLQSDPTLPLFGARDAAVTLDARVEAYDAGAGLATLTVAGGRFRLPSAALPLGEWHRLRVAAGDVSLTRDEPSRTTIINVFAVQILDATATGAHEVTAVLGMGVGGVETRLLTRVTRHSWTTLGLAPGERLYAQVKGVALAPSHRPDPGSPVGSAAQAGAKVIATPLMQ